MFGEYYILSENNFISAPNLKSEEELIILLQKNRYVAIRQDDNKKSMYLFGEDYDLYYETREYIDTEIKKIISPIKITTPTLYKHSSRLAKLQEQFGLELFKCSMDMVLRPATDYGVFSLLEDTILKIRDLPIAYYELGTCFRIENEFDSSLLRSYSFDLPDIHVIVNGHYYEMVNAHLLLHKHILENLGIDFVVVLRITQNEFNRYSQQIESIASNLDRNILINVVPSSIRYWESKFKFVQVNQLNKQVQLSTVQVDYQSSKIFNFKDEFKENLVVIHSSPGSVQRLLYCLTKQSEVCGI